MIPWPDFSFQDFPLTSLRAMGQESREVLKDHTPRKAAEAIYRACEIAMKHRGKRLTT